MCLCSPPCKEFFCQTAGRCLAFRRLSTAHPLCGHLHEQWPSAEQESFEDSSYEESDSHHCSGYELYVLGSLCFRC